MSSDSVLMEMKEITKRYPGVTALDNVHFELKRGEVHALVGENGAGKSTLMKVLMGIEKKDRGEILIYGKPVKINNAQEAVDYKIASVFQELSQIPYLSVGENVFLGKEHSPFLLNRKKMISETTKICEAYNIDLDPRSTIEDLSSAKRQIAEIIKAIAIKPEILILDEPTSSLTEDEAEKLFEIIRTFKKQGIGIIYISHRMNELEKIADRITVLRDGKYIDTRTMSEVTIDNIVTMMVGREVELYKSEKDEYIDLSNSKKVLEVRNLSKRGEFRDISFDLHQGEVLGIAGLVGSGRSELMNLLFGIDHIDSGEIILNGKHCIINNVGDALKNKIAMIPESRHQQGLVLMHSVADNICLPVIKRFQKSGFLRNSMKQKFAVEMIDKYNVKTESAQKLVKYLSGGNQQKVVIAKWLATNPDILIVDELTTGIDVHSKAEIHRLIHSLTNKGLSVIMISSEMPELLAHSDRVMVMNDNHILGILTDPDQEKIMHMIMEDKNKSNNRRMEEGTNG